MYIVLTLRLLWLASWDSITESLPDWIAANKLCTIYALIWNSYMQQAMVNSWIQVLCYIAPCSNKNLGCIHQIKSTTGDVIIVSHNKDRNQHDCRTLCKGPSILHYNCYRYIDYKFLMQLNAMHCVLSSHCCSTAMQ